MSINTDSEPILFTFVIPSYNREKMIGQTIDSVLKQIYPHFEIIVVDDGSKDNTEQVVKAIKDPRISYYKKENGERGAARNFGAQRAKGHYINFLDSDDWLYPHHLNVALDLLQETNYPEVIYLNYDLRNDDGSLIRVAPPIEGDLRHILVHGNLLSLNGVLVKNKIAQENPFNEDRHLSPSEDWELWLRLAARFPIHVSNEVTSTVVIHPQRSLLTTQLLSTVQSVMLVKKYLYQDNVFLSYYAKYLGSFLSHVYLYAALQYSLTKKYRLKTIEHLFKAVINNPSCITTRTFWATIKHFF